MNEHIVITGATRGIGFGLAKAFLERGCAVAVSGRAQTSVDDALRKLAGQFPQADLLGRICDVRQSGQVQALWDAAMEHWGAIDLWVNNAGISGPQALIWELPGVVPTDVINTNILGTLYGCQIAIQGMLKQGHGAIYNMEGMGSDGRMHAGLTSYGTSKYAISYFTRALAKELKAQPVIIGSLRPGMVVTTFLTDQYRHRPEEFERAKRIFNIIAERTETVTPWLAERMLTNTKSGVVLSYTSRLKLMWRFLTAPIIKRELFDEG
jgi:NAD(P)-dependent dehydrogenase (short-subunit alcohol dehydrogenase family)